MKKSLATLALFLSTSLVFADAELPDSNLIKPSDMPPAVLELTKQTCQKEEGLMEEEKWDVHKFTLDDTNLYFVWCVPFGSNDNRFVIAETKDTPRLLSFGDNIIFVSNIRFNPAKKELIDISSGGAGSVSKRVWTWKKDQFVLTSGKQ